MARLSCIPHKVSDDGVKQDDPETHRSFLQALEDSCSNGLIHDCLELGGGLSWANVMLWKMMEYLPFRRMDLQKNGSWKPIRWRVSQNPRILSFPNDSR